MKDIRLTRRGKVLLAVAILATFWALLNAVTPDECKARPLTAECEAYLR